MKTKNLFCILLTATLLLVLLPAAAFGSNNIAIDKNNFPDDNFRAYVAQFDTDGNHSLSAAERAAVTAISVSSATKVVDYTGLEHFSALTELIVCGENSSPPYPRIKLDISTNPALEYLMIYFYSFGDETLDLRSNPALTYVFIYSCELEAIDLSGCPELDELTLVKTGVSDLDLTDNPKLRSLELQGTPIRSLDLVNQSDLVVLNVSDCAITELDISACLHLRALIQNNVLAHGIDDHIYYSVGEVNLIVNRALTLIVDSRKVSYAPGEGTGKMQPTLVRTEEDYRLPECGFTAPEGKRFKAWGCELSEDTFLPGKPATIEEDVTFTALWEDIPKPTFLDKIKAFFGKILAFLKLLFGGACDIAVG